MNPGKNLHIGFKSTEIPSGKPTAQHMGDSFLARFFFLCLTMHNFFFLIENHFPLQEKAMLIYLYI